MRLRDPASVTPTAAVYGKVPIRSSGPIISHRGIGPKPPSRGDSLVRPLQEAPGSPLPLDALDEARLRRLVDVGPTLGAELHLDSVLDRLLTVAREVTGARY